jgi:hypothetical protein
VSIGANSTTTTAPRGLRLGLQDSAGVKVDTGRVLGWVAVCIIGGAIAGL